MAADRPLPWGLLCRLPWSCSCDDAKGVGCGSRPALLLHSGVVPWQVHVSMDAWMHVCTHAHTGKGQTDFLKTAWASLSGLTWHLLGHQQTNSSGGCHSYHSSRAGRSRFVEEAKRRGPPGHSPFYSGCAARFCGLRTVRKDISSHAGGEAHVVTMRLWASSLGQGDS